MLARWGSLPVFVAPAAVCASGFDIWRLKSGLLTAGREGGANGENERFARVMVLRGES
jgi:hypothetical protein